MNETSLPRHNQIALTTEDSDISHYLSLGFYRENLDQFANITRDSINNFLKSISEIEDEFASTLKAHAKNLEAGDAEPANEQALYMEENY